MDSDSSFSSSTPTHDAIYAQGLCTVALVVWAAVETTLNKIPIILKSHVKKSINLGVYII